MNPHPDTAARERASELLAQMSDAERAGQLIQYFYFGLLRDPAHQDPEGGMGAEQPEAVEAALARGGAGSLLYVDDPAETNRLQRLAIAGNRLGVPVLFGYDVVHGLRTMLPVPIALAATWDPAIVERSQEVAGREARAVGIHWTFAPVLDIARDPRWGRIIEGAGEDPYLCAAIGAAQVRGFQNGGVIAGPKHFAGYGAAIGGRDYDEVYLSDYELWNVYLPPFRAAVEAGAGNVMTAYMPLNGVPATGNPWLLQTVLRDAFGFDGWVVSDANAVRSLETHGFARDQTDAGARALAAGCDMEMAIFDPAFTHLPDAIERGLIDEARLNEAARRVLEAKARIGLLDAPFVDEAHAESVLADPAHRDVARVAAERAAVLLRNEGDLLPLSADSLGSIAVIGALADSKRDILGPWSFAFDLAETASVLDGIRARAGSGVRVDYAPGVRPAKRLFPSLFDLLPGNTPEDPVEFDDDAELQRAADLARESDVAIVVVGEWQHLVGERSSRSSLELPGRQLELVQAVSATGTPVVLLVMNGRPLDLRWAAEHVPAILDIWYPGTRGGEAVANLLFGDVAPGGKLPFTWPRTVGHIPMFYNHTVTHEPKNQGRRYWDEPSTPLFPFGHGLSYTRFSYANATVDRERIVAGESIHVSAEVSNVGARAGDEVVQLYIHQRHGRAARPIRELKGFQRVALDAGETRTVRFTLGPDELRCWHPLERDWVIDAATFDVWVGGDSTASLATSFTVVDR